MDKKPIFGTKTTSDWKKILTQKDRALLEGLNHIYGKNPELIQEKIQRLIELVGHFENTFGAGGMVGIIRVPGRLNTLGMHADHRGSYVNPIAIQKAAILCYQANEDDSIEIHDIDAAYGARAFNIDSEQPARPIDSVDEWLHVTQELADRRIQQGTNHDWVNKVKSAPVYLRRMIYREKPLRGFRAVFSSTIPPKTGLSSSSALVIAVFEAMLDVNNLNIEFTDYAFHCGVAEWFVGTRGGFGDQAAIIYSRPGMITHMKTTPELVIGEYLPFPTGYSIIVFDSGMESDKTGSSGNKFNEKTATYEIGEIYLRKFIRQDHPDMFQRVLDEREKLGPDVKKFHLQDIVENLPEEEIFRLLLRLPRRISRRQLLTELPDQADELQKQFATHAEPEHEYPVRAVLTYGLAENSRAMRLKDILERGQIDRFGKFMNLSHNGDRVSGMTEPIKSLKEDIDPNLDLCSQIGDYDCSIPEIDRMVDIALANGALGAQISGAGLGGSMMALVQDGSVPALVNAMEKEYYRPQAIEPKYLKALPVAGAGRL